MKGSVYIYLVLILIISILLLGCQNKSNQEIANVMLDYSTPKVNISETELRDNYSQITASTIKPERIGILSNGYFISTTDEAINVGQYIINKCHENYAFTRYELISIIHSTQDNIWEFHYSYPRDESGNIMIMGGVFYAAIDGNSGEIIKLWSEY